MSILTASSPRVVRSFSTARLPLKPIRIAPKPAAPFADGIVVDTPGESCPIDQRELPKINGTGLWSHEFAKVIAAEFRAAAAYKADCPTASQAEIDRIGELAATDELRRVLMARPAAPELKATEPAKATLPANARIDAAAKPLSKPTTVPVRKVAAVDRRKSYTALDAAWWAANSPTSRFGGWIDGKLDPTDLEYRTISWLDYDREDPTTDEALCLSGDANGQFGYVREGGAL